MTQETFSGTGLVADPISRIHQTGFGHPERPERFDAVLDALRTSGLLEQLIPIEARNADDAELERCHMPEYIALARREIAAGWPMLSTGDTVICEDTMEPALRAAGGVMNAVDAVCEGRVRNVFCVQRPPGHHATPDAGMGFCVFNNIAVGARHAQAKHGIERVLIADWDVHHGNGTQDIFYEDPSVFFFSTHQWPLYPGTGSEREIGAGEGRGTTLNCPFPAGSGRHEIVNAFRERLMPAAEAFRPDLVMISAGFDSRIDDPLGGFLLTDDDFAELTQLVMQIAERHANGRIVSVLEGGYGLAGLGSAAASHVGALMGRI